MTVGISWAQIVDLGFIGLVTLACLRSLMTDTEAGERTARRWREELRALEQSLRILIEEAGTASSSLDRRLVQRKQELEQVLKRVEDSSNDIERYAGEQRQSNSIKPILSPQRAQKVSKPTPAVDSSEPLSDLTNFYNAYDEAEVPTRKVPTASKPERNLEKNDIRRRSLLEEQIEVIRAKQEEDNYDEIFRQLSLTDPVAYKIARRLLLSGAEIHVVARKLDIPVSEVRLLDKLLRQYQKGSDPKEAMSAETQVGIAVPSLLKRAEQQEDSFLPEAFERRRRGMARTTQDEIDIEIEREMALL